MYTKTDLCCSICGQKLKYYDNVPRIVRTKNRETRVIRINLFQCRQCSKSKRYLPNYIFPYKQYEKEVIQGVLEGIITCETMGYEDYPCEMTMLRWKASSALQKLL